MTGRFGMHFKAMGGINEVQLYAANETEARRIVAPVLGEVRRIEAKFSRFREDSFLGRLASSAGGDAIKVDRETAKLIDFAKACFEESNGLFDITSGALQKAWDFSTATLPSSEDLAAAQEFVGWQKVEWQDPWIRLPKPGMTLDLGGLAKEYAVDRAAEVLRGSGIDSALLNFAGDVVAVGPKPNGAPWHVGVSNPRNPGKPYDSVALFCGSLTTSGDYERFKMVDGVRYCHILNPTTAYPVQGIRSVSVLAESCLVAGGLSTMTMLLGLEQGPKLLKRAQAPYLIISDCGQLAHQWPGTASSVLNEVCSQM